MSDQWAVVTGVSGVLAAVAVLTLLARPAEYRTFRRRRALRRERRLEGVRHPGRRARRPRAFHRRMSARPLPPAPDRSARPDAAAMASSASPASRLETDAAFARMDDMRFRVRVDAVMEAGALVEISPVDDEALRDEEPRAHAEAEATGSALD